ncbi:hypothetical protein MHW47_12970 [Streptomyces sp. OfavH-34-F]|uniref:hypothetical protein n=1 Tax=unclassified Streptomyces TaxID=2593676 RepID=UPI000DAC04BD|nr:MULTISPECIES: hypothetical protein [unclassified Streptomyces]MCG7525352.1 hypothetical protein [Streptomyces sp. OfavH-34-F]PZT77571.1 hypothetical protein DNK56_30840 [Streptomyces sp. AC1-42W]PZT78475.1 hypothetical protein DNK55_01845 [Streptomyces sp. AC1-42T]
MKNSSRTAAATGAAALLAAGLLVAGATTASAAPANGERITSLEQLKAHIEQATHLDAGGPLGTDPVGQAV